MTESQFNELAAAGHNRIPLVLETYADLDTPLSVYLKLANKPYTYLLESVVGGERFGRYSFIGLAAQARLEVRGLECTEYEEGKPARSTTCDDPLQFVREYQARFKAATQPGLPRFCGGLVGYFGYDTIRYIEKKLAATKKPDPLGVPDIMLLVSEQLAQGREQFAQTCAAARVGARLARISVHHEVNLA
jgi:anthranilate synthase component I